MNKKFIYGLVAAAIVLLITVGVFVFKGNKSSDSDDNKAPIVNETETSTIISDTDENKVLIEKLVSIAKDYYADKSNYIDSDFNLLKSENYEGENVPNGFLFLSEQGDIALAVSYGNKCYSKAGTNEEIRVINNFKECGVDALKPTPTYLNACYRFDKNSGTIIKYFKDCAPENTHNVVIPETIGGVAVKKIGNSAFKESELTSVEIPKSVTSIGDFAFYSNYLNSVDIPSSVISIGTAAFNHNQFAMNDAFIYQPNTDNTHLVSYAGNYLYINDPYEKFAIPNGITSIGDYTFSKVGLEKLVIPNSVKSIGAFAFSGNSLTSLNIPSSVTSIGAGAFNNNKIIESQAYIYKPGSSSTYLVSYGGYKPLRKCDENAVDCLQAYGVATIPSGVVTIGQNAFTDTLVGTISIPETVRTIEKRAFAGITLYGEVAIPNGVVTIAEEAFLTQSYFITDIKISDTVQTIGVRAFAMCNGNNVSTVDIGKGIISIGEEAFDCIGIDAEKSTVIIRKKEGTVNIGLNAFRSLGEYSIKPTYLP